jgi:hypothetical protein
MICDTSEHKFPAFVLKKGVELANGTYQIAFTPEETCIGGIISVIIKHNVKVSKTGIETTSYYIFEMLNSAPTNKFRLRKFSDNIMKDIQTIETKDELNGGDPNMNIVLGFVPTKEHQVVVTSNGTNITILMSVNKSKFIKIFSFEGADIKKGGIGVGTCKCQVKFGDMSMRPPKLALSPEQKRAIVNNNGPNIIAPKGAWVNESNDPESKFQKAQRKKEQNEKDRSNAKAGNTAWNSSPGGSKESGATNEVEKAQNAFNANNNGDYTNMEVQNNLENGLTIFNYKNGQAGWSTGGNSANNRSSKSYSKDFVSGWEVCITNRTADQRTGYCNRINTAPLKKNCNNNFCDYCCNDRIGTGRSNVLHQCVKLCNQSTASQANVDGINKCISPTQENNVNSYCLAKMKGKAKGKITKCKLDMCNLCCSTLDAQEESKISNNATSSCYSHCSNKYNSNTDNKKFKELGSEDEEDRQ